MSYINDDLVQLKFHRVNEQLKHLTDQFQSYDRVKLMKNCLEKLNQWRLESHEIIEGFYREKCEELNGSIENVLNKQEETILDLRLQLAKTINVQQTNNLQILEDEIQRIEQSSIQININSLKLDANLIRIHLINSPLTPSLLLTSPNQILHRTPLSSDAMASNHQSLLIHQNSHLYLIDKNCRTQHEHRWPYDYIKDMCWSTNLKCFFLLTSNQIYLVEKDLVTIRSLSTIEGRSWQSCTCSDTSLYLTKDQWNPSIDEISLTSFEWIQNYQRSETQTNKQRIDHLEYHQNTIALLVNDQTNEKIFLELRTMPAFDCLWLYQFSVEYSERKLTCCAFQSHSWMIADWQNSSIFQINKTGQLKQTLKYDSQIHCLHLFDQKQLVISTNTNIHFHKL